MKKTLFALILILGFLSLPLWAADPAPQAPADVLAQQFKRAREEALQGDWLAAAGNFEQTLERSPLLAESFFNLGAAYQNAGSPVLASLWYRAYLETLGDSEERKTLLKEIAQLDQLSDAKARQILNLAAEGIEKIPEDLWQERQQVLETQALLEALTGRLDRAMQLIQMGVRPIPRSYFLQKYADALAAVHSYTQIEELLKSASDPVEADVMLETLVKYQTLRGEHDQARAALQKIIDPFRRQALLAQLMASETRTFNPDTAQKLLDDARDAKEKSGLEAVLLLAYLRNGRQSEAAALAGQIQIEAAAGAQNAASLRLARVVLGEGTQVFSELKALPEGPGQDAPKISGVYRATLAALWSGNSKLAQSGCEWMQRWVQPESRKAFADYAVIACGYEQAESKSVRAALPAIQQIKGSAQTDFALSLFFRLASQKRWDEIQNLILALVGNPETQGVLMAELASALSREGRAGEAWVTAQLAADQAVRGRLGMVLHRLSRWGADNHQEDFAGQMRLAEKIANWTLLAHSMEKQTSVLDLDQYVKANSTTDLLASIARLQQAASQWINAGIFIHGIEKRHRAL